MEPPHRGALHQVPAIQAAVRSTEEEKDLHGRVRNWYQLFDRKEKDRFSGRATDEYKQYIGRLQRREVSPVPETRLREDLEKIEGLKHDNLAFNVVFQKAYFLGFMDFRQITAAHVDELAGDRDGMPDLDEEETESVDVETEDLAESEVGESGGFTNSAAETLAERTQERAKQYVEALNSLVAAWPEFLSIDATFADDQGQREALVARHSAQGRGRDRFHTGRVNPGRRDLLMGRRYGAL